MTEVQVAPTEDGGFAVTVTGGDTVTTHRVTVPAPLLARLGGPDPAAVVRESFAFLLEREPAASILPEFSLDQIAHYFPEYDREIEKRLGP